MRFIEKALKIKAAADKTAAFFERNSHFKNVLLLTAGYLLARLSALRVVEKSGDAVFKWRILRLWCETGNYPATIPEHHQGRWMLNLPVRALMEVFGTDPWVYYIYPLLMGLVCVLSIYFIASRLSGKFHGVLAFLLFAFLPVAADESMQFLPLVPATGYTMLAVLAMLRYFDTRREMWTLAAGLLLGLGYGCKVTMAYWYVPFALGLIWFAPAAADGHCRFPFAALLMLLTGGALVLVWEFFMLNAFFGVKWGRLSMLLSGHIGHRIEPQYLTWYEYLLSALRPLRTSGKTVYVVPRIMLVIWSSISAVLVMRNRSADRVKRFAALCYICVYLLHCYVVYKFFPFLHPERPHARYLLAMFAMGTALSTASGEEWRMLLRRWGAAPWVGVVSFILFWGTMTGFLVSSFLNPILNGDHPGAILARRRLLVRDGTPAVLRFEPKKRSSTTKEEKYARMYIVMFAPLDELRRVNAEPRALYHDADGRSYLRLWGEIPEGAPCRVRVCEEQFCDQEQLVLKREKKR